VRDFDFGLKSFFNYKNLVRTMIFIFILGCVILGLGLKYQKDNKILIGNCTRKVEAECVSINEHVIHSRGSNSYSYHPCFKFEINGIEYKVTSDIGLGEFQDQYYKGEKYTIYVNPSNPNEITDDYFNEARTKNVNKITAWGAGITGISFLLIVFGLIKLKQNGELNLRSL